MIQNPQPTVYGSHSVLTQEPISALRLTYRTTQKKVVKLENLSCYRGPSITTVFIALRLQLVYLRRTGC